MYIQNTSESQSANTVKTVTTFPNHKAINQMNLMKTRNIEANPLKQTPADTKGKNKSEYDSLLALLVIYILFCDCGTSDAEIIGMLLCSVMFI